MRLEGRIMFGLDGLMMVKMGMIMMNCLCEMVRPLTNRSCVSRKVHISKPHDCNFPTCRGGNQS